MARTRKTLPSRVDVAHLISAGVLASVCVRTLIEEVLAETGKASQRERLLPAPAVVYYVMALALWREAPLEEVLRVVCEGLQWLGGGHTEAVQASKSAISQARSRLGPEVMRQLADRVLRPLAAPGAPGAWYRGLRVMAWTAAAWTWPTGGQRQVLRLPGRLARPKRLPAGARSGPGGMRHARGGGSRHRTLRCHSSEQVMAAQLLPAKLTPEMLVLADRNFYGFKLWQTACATGAKLAWRVKSNLKLPVEQMLPDGSYLSRVFDSDDRARRAGQTVRVIDYALEGSATPAQGSYRLLTNLLDPDAAPAPGAGRAVPRALGDRGVFDEFKTHLRANSTVLRSKTPSWCSRSCGGCCWRTLRFAS
jgi:hypothetical protein